VFLSLFLTAIHDDIAICSDQKSSFENESWNRYAANCGGDWPQRPKLIALEDNCNGNEVRRSQLPFSEINKFQRPFL
jgi:hypothetical protein